MVEHFSSSKVSFLCCSKSERSSVMQALGSQQLDNIRELESFKTYLEKLTESESSNLKDIDSFKVILNIRV